MSTSLDWTSRPSDVFAELPTAHMTHATVLITGPTSGVGETAAVAFASLGCRLVLAARSESRVQEMLERRNLRSHSNISFIPCDLNSLSDVAACATRFLEMQRSEGWPPLKVLVLNAGVYNFSGGYKASADGFESTFAVNHLGHFLLTLKLMPALEAAAPSRVVVVGSGSQFGPLTTHCVEERSALQALAMPDESTQKRFWHVAASRAYGSSKLANTMFARSIHAKFSAKGIACCSLHPGTLMASDMGRESNVANFVLKRVLSWVTKDLQQGASTTLYCSLAPHESLEGEFFSDCGRAKRSNLATDTACELLWQLSLELCQPFNM